MCTAFYLILTNFYPNKCYESNISEGGKFRKRRNLHFLQLTSSWCLLYFCLGFTKQVALNTCSTGPADGSNLLLFICQHVDDLLSARN